MSILKKIVQLVGEAIEQHFITVKLNINVTLMILILKQKK